MPCGYAAHRVSSSGQGKARGEGKQDASPGPPGSGPAGPAACSPPSSARPLEEHIIASSRSAFCPPRRQWPAAFPASIRPAPVRHRSEEHTSELQSLMRISYAVFCLKKKNKKKKQQLQTKQTIPRL